MKTGAPAQAAASPIQKDIIMDMTIEKPDFAAIKARQQATWASGDYAMIGTTLQIVGETLCEAVDLRAGETVLDVAAGNGNATLAAARRFARVTSTDYVPALLDKACARSCSGVNMTPNVDNATSKLASAKGSASASAS
jgi:protein-L-isoaspartate O-methyltransferase